MRRKLLACLVRTHPFGGEPAMADSKLPMTLVELANEYLSRNDRAPTYDHAMKTLTAALTDFLDSEEGVAAKKLLKTTGHWIILATSMPRMHLMERPATMTVYALTKHGLVTMRDFSSDKFDQELGQYTQLITPRDAAVAMIRNVLGPLPDLDNPLGYIRQELDRLAKLVLAK